MAPPNTQYGIVGSRLGFRLNYLSAALRAERESWTTFQLNGAPVQVRYNSVTIHDVINDAPNTCTLTIDAATPPAVGQRLTVRINSNAPRTLFAGPIQTVGYTFELQPKHTVYPCQAIDDTPLANRKLPYGQWVNTSATTVAQWLVATFAPGFTATAVQAGLPAVSVNFDATEGMDGCLRQLAKLIGGYFYWDDKVLHLFISETSDAPDPIDDLHPFLLDPPVSVSTDTSQVRTRVYGKGYAEEIIADVAANDPIVPISNAIMFNPAGGQAVTETQRLRYTGTAPGGGGTVVGPGISPSAAPVATIAPGAGVTLGYHDYAVTFGTATGESLPGPRYPILVTGTTPPPVAPTFGAPGAVASAGVNPGTHTYALTNVTASGETAPSTTAAYTLPTLTDPAAAPVYNNTTVGTYMPPTGRWIAGAQVTFYCSYSALNAYPTFPSETNLSLGSAPVTLKEYPGGTPTFWMPPNLIVPASADPAVLRIDLWGFVPGDPAARFCGSATNVPGTAPIISAYLDTALINFPGAHPSLNRVTVNLPLPADALATGRRVYRTAAGGSQLKLVATIAATTATYADSTPDAALGANAPTVNTATAAQVQVTGIPLGGAGVTARRLYRSAANTTALQRLADILDNTTTSYLDALADATLTNPAPPSDTSGLQQPAGAVIAGSPTIIVAGAGWARAGGGWAIIGNGQQTIRYASISGNSLTGIPATGPGAITATISYNSTITGAAALLGVTGLVRALIKGAPINLWVERNDPAAQASIAAVDGSDGIIEHLITDERRGEASLIQLCDADLKQYSYPIRTVPYATRDVKTKSGKPIVINLTTPAISATLTIQDVTITEINLATGLAPRFSVMASSVRFSIEDILRRLGASLDVTS